METVLTIASKTPTKHVACGSLCNMRKTNKVEWVNKHHRFKKELDDRLQKLREETGVTERHAFEEAMNAWLTVKGY